MPFLFRYLFACCILMSLTLSAQAAPSADEAKTRLKKIQTEILELRKILETKRGKQGKLQARLRKQEKQISRVSRDIKRIDQDLAKLQNTLKKKRREKAKQLNILDQHKEALAQQVRSAYKLGGQEPVKLVLNQEDPALVGRTFAYYQYFTRARLTQIEVINTALADLRAIEQEIAIKSNELNEKKARKESAKKELVAAKKEREQVLAKLSREIRKKGKTLDTLLEDEENLQALISSINEALSDIPSDLDQGKPFAQLKGKLPWPVKGTLSNKFGQKKNGTQGKIRWNGVQIKAQTGNPVYAIARGRVAFADWMRGFGLLVIIDHSDGYMTLYGHNESLYVAPGDWVGKGDIISTVGNSGGSLQSGLYFEIRHNSKPVNPRGWCHGQFEMAGL
jgi:septal ring factor EnvC (AmiA/AmiB activator)